ncbi:MAG: hypothetical protein AABY22_32780 [Nanoarchaeota archaeon]|mgnify:CR=1 FL=1
MQQKIKEVKIPKWIKESLKEQAIDTQVIDFKSYSNDELLEDYLKREYAIIVSKPITRKKIKAEQQLKTETDLLALKKNIEVKKEELNKIIEDSKKNDINDMFSGQEIIKEIYDYNLYGENLVISTLLAVALKKNIINYGSYGNSKTYATKTLLDKLELPYTEIIGHQTPKSFFDKLDILNGTLIIIDESANLLKNPEIQDMLLSALQKSQVRWTTTKETKEFDFNGTVIFNTNYLPNNPILKAVADRCLFNKVKVDSNQFKERINLTRTYNFNKDIWNRIKQNLWRDINLSKEDENILYKILNELELKSMRDKDRLFEVALLSLKLTNAMELIKPFIKLNTIDFILNQDKKKSEIAKELAIEKKVSLRQAQRIIKGGKNK